MATLDPSLDPEATLLCFVHSVASNHARDLGASQAMQEDLAQEAVAECLARMRAGTWRERGDVRALVRSIVRSRCIDRSRRRRRDRDRVEQFTREIAAGRRAWMSPELAMEERELAALAARTLEQLPRRCRSVFEMAREERATYQMVAERMGITVSTVKLHVATARRHFRTALQSQGFADRAMRRRQHGGNAA